MRIGVPTLLGLRSTRLLIFGTLFSSFGLGLYGTASIVFFADILHFTPGGIAALLTASGVCGLIAAVPIGRLSDRVGASRMAAISVAVQVPVLITIPFIDSYWLAIPLVAVTGFGARSLSVVRQAVIARVSTPHDRIRVQAFVRSASNGSMAVGALGAVPALSSGGREAYVITFVLAAAAYVLSGILFLRIGEEKGIAERTSRQRLTRRDTPFFLLGVLCGVVGLHASILDVGIPLWVVYRTDVPPSLIGIIVALNTGLVVLLQVPLSRGSGTLRGAKRAVFASACFVALTCVLLSLAVGGETPRVTVLLVLSAISLTIGELLHAAGTWGLSFSLAPSGAQGAYFGVFALGGALQDLIGPSIVAAVVSQHLPGGWFLPVLAIMLAGVLASPVTGLAARHTAARHEEHATGDEADTQLAVTADRRPAVGSES